MDDDLLARLRPRFVGDLGEGCPKAPIVGLAPFFIGMMVALGTLHPLAEEQLGNVFQLGLNGTDLTEPGHGRIFRDLARSRQ